MSEKSVSEQERTCPSCEHGDKQAHLKPCNSCVYDEKHPNWEPKH